MSLGGAHRTSVPRPQQPPFLGHRWYPALENTVAAWAVEFREADDQVGRE